MCGRYAIEMLDKEYQAFMRRVLKAEPPEAKARYNVAPSQLAPVLRVVEGAPRWEELRWGFRPAWLKEKHKAQINARAETVFESRMFKSSALSRRCIVPASGWYEWQATGTGRKQPFYIHRADGGTLSFAGIWTTWRDEAGQEEHSFAILTTDANPLIEAIHDRMPVILSEKDFGAWLDPEFQDVKKLAALLRPYTPKDLEAYSVSTYVNSPRNTGEQCIERIEVPSRRGGE